MLRRAHLGTVNDWAIWWMLCHQDPKALPFAQGLQRLRGRKSGTQRGRVNSGVKGLQGNNREETEAGHRGSRAKVKVEGR